MDSDIDAEVCRVKVQKSRKIKFVKDEGSKFVNQFK